MDRHEINISLAAALKATQPNDVIFRGSDQDRRLYRAVLTRHKLYKNGKRRFHVLLVETFDHTGNSEEEYLVWYATNRRPIEGSRDQGAVRRPWRHGVRRL